MAEKTRKTTHVEISRGYAEISRGRVLKSAGGMLKSTMAPCRNRQHIDNNTQQAKKVSREQRQVEFISTKATTVAFKHPWGAFVQLQADCTLK